MTDAYLSLLNPGRVASDNSFEAQENLLLSLPSDVISEIFSCLQWRETVRSLGVCKQLGSSLSNQFLWKGYCLQEFPFCDTARLQTWKDIFQFHTKLKIGWTTGRPKDFKMTPWRGHRDYVNCFSLYKKLVASGSADQTIRLWKFGDDEETKNFSGHKGLIHTIKFSELFLVSGSADSTAKIWDLHTASCLHTLQHKGDVESLYFDDNVVYTASKDRSVRVWDIRTGQVTHTLKCLSSPFWINPLNGTQLSSTSADEIRVWDLKKADNDHCVRTMATTNVTHANYLGNNTLVTGHSDGTITTWDCVGALKNEAKVSALPVSCLAVSGDSVISGHENDLVLLDTQTQQTQHLKDHTSPVNDVQFDENRVVSCGQDGCIKVWDRKTGNRLYSLLGGSLQARGRNPAHPTRPGVSGVAFDQSRIVGSVNNMLRVYSFVADMPNM
eukprot:TRINITY_DN9695_c0_g1_i1.p1 TRINITY_DN9695_c0_g1~~TRINITY_DN9695_c0_g1_i1.p1  ORF type:complete len:483 (+),score=54.58 TRINITY_DN9695_c0_g1_i1:128-1450(+)